MAKVVSLIARKGGVGKTTIAGNLSGELAASGMNVRLIDADPQLSLLGWAKMGNGFLSSRVTGVEAGDEKLFRDTVKRLSAECDVLVIDTPPGFTEPALLAASVSDLVLLPCGASPFDLTAARDAVHWFRKLNGQRKKGLTIGLVPSRFLRTSLLGRDLPVSLGQLGELTLPGITHRVALAEAAISGSTIGEFAKDSPGHMEFKELAKAVWRGLNEERTAAKA